MYEPLMWSFLFLYLYRILFTALAPLPVTFLRAAPMKPTFSGISTCWQTSGFRFSALVIAQILGVSLTV